MHYYLFVRLDHFYARTLEASDARLADRPLIVHHEKQVLDINLHATALGAKIGMALSEAKALAHGAAFVRWEEEPYRGAQETWLDVCAEFSDVIEPETQNGAYVDLSGHPDPGSIAWLLQKALRERLNWDSRTGIAGSKWIAKVAQLVGEEGEAAMPHLEAAHNPAAFLAGLKPWLLLPAEEEDRRRLRFLGYRTIGEVASIPTGVLRDQFGLNGLIIRQAANGGVFQKVRAVYPKDSVSTRVRFEGGVSEEEVFNQGLTSLAKKLSELLKERDSQGCEIKVLLEFEDGDALKTARKFMKPMQSARAVYSGLKLLLKSAVERPVVEVRARMPNLAKAERFQRELSGAHSAAERAAGTIAAFNHIRTVFGDHAIEIAGQLKEPRRKAVLRYWKDATGWS